MAHDGLANAEHHGRLFHAFSGASSGEALRSLFGRCCGGARLRQISRPSRPRHFPMCHNRPQQPREAGLL